MSNCDNKNNNSEDSRVQPRRSMRPACPRPPRHPYGNVYSRSCPLPPRIFASRNWSSRPLLPPPYPPPSLSHFSSLNLNGRNSGACKPVSICSTGTERSLSSVGLDVNQWFLIKFCGRFTAYELFCNEFQELEQNTEVSTEKKVASLLKPSQISRTIQSTHFAVKAHKIDGIDGWTYIACEGPTTSSVYDFWNLVWQEKVGGIFMLNQPCEERRHPKSYDPAHETIQYWPVKTGEIKNFAPWKIECLDTKLKCKPADDEVFDSLDHEDVVYRVTRLRVTETNPITQPQPRQIIHVCHYKWIDCKLPQAPSSIHLVDIMNEELNGIRGSMLVHCHAGVGRTGVAIVLHIAALRLTNLGLTDVRETVRAVRKQRPRSVMNRWQYAFCNIALAELALRHEWIESTVGGMERACKYMAPGNRVSKHTSPSTLVQQSFKHMITDMNSYFTPQSSAATT